MFEKMTTFFEPHLFFVLLGSIHPNVFFVKGYLWITILTKPG